MFGSADLTATLLEEKAVDEMRLFLVPTILGRGTPLFQVGDGGFQLVAPLACSPRGGRIGEMGRIVDAGAPLLRLDLPVEIVRDPPEVGDHHVGLGKLAFQLPDLELDVLDVEVRRPTLDDVFLTLTGHAAEGDATETTDEAEEEA